MRWLYCGWTYYCIQGTKSTDFTCVWWWEELGEDGGGQPCAVLFRDVGKHEHAEGNHDGKAEVLTLQPRSPKTLLAEGNIPAFKAYILQKSNQSSTITHHQLSVSVLLGLFGLKYLGYSFHSYTWWLMSQSKSFLGLEQVFLEVG